MKFFKVAQKFGKAIVFGAAGAASLGVAISSLLTSKDEEDDCDDEDEDYDEPDDDEEMDETITDETVDESE